MPELQLASIVSILEETIAYFRARGPQFGRHEIDYSVHDEVPRIPLNPDLIGWVFENLFKNAVDALEEDVGSIRIDIRVPDELQMVQITFRDTGRGIAPDHVGRIFDPALNIVDALVSQAGQEWGDGEPRVTNALIAGDQVIATDACVAHLMGHDPKADWLTPPFHRDRNALLVAAESGYGSVDLDEIDFYSEVQRPLGHFFANEPDSRATVISWRRTTAGRR